MIALTVAAVLIIVVTAGVLRRRLYRRSFGLPPRRHDTINCRNSRDAIAVRAAPDSICIPDNLKPRGQTAFLQLTVNATLPGRWVDPFIEIQDEQHVYRQYFERGAAGQRYLNLSPVFQRSDRNSLPKILLRGRSIRWEPAAALLLFESPSLETPPCWCSHRILTMRKSLRSACMQLVDHGSLRSPPGKGRPAIWRPSSPTIRGRTGRQRRASGTVCPFRNSAKRLPGDA